MVVQNLIQIDNVKENLEEQQFEEFDVLSDLYLPLRAEEEKYAIQQLHS